MGFGGFLFVAGCSRSESQPEFRDDLDDMATDRIRIGDQVFEVWLASTPAQRSRGLMQVPAEALLSIPPDAGRGLPRGAERGMLFVFEKQRLQAFWMFNTIIPLDIAFIRADGTIVTTYTMAPNETRSYPSIEPVRFALEVRAGLFEKLGISPGDRVEIPRSVLKSSS
jgi:hypothetical protein